MKNIFRVVALLEGVSYVLLITFGLYFKYYLDDETYVKILGMPHGILFMLYILLVFIVNRYEKWNYKDLLIILFASVIPMGTFYIDRKYL